MIDRYSLPEMSRIWTDENRFRKMLDVEIAACQAMAREGLIPVKSARTIRRKARFKLAEIREFEKTTKHDVTAFLKSVGKSVGPDARFVHLGLTSSDALDTALSLQIREAMGLVLEKAGAFEKLLEKLSIKYKHTPAMGRTHGVHAEPTTFGLKLLVFVKEVERGIGRVARAREGISYGKLSGAVGTHASVSPSLERRTMKILGLKPAPASTQVLQRDRHAEVMASLAILGATLEKIAVEIRHLARTEVREAEENFSEGQTGSSAMPHKKNPVNCERVTGLSRLLRAYLGASLENIALWHERDISHSSVERVILPDAFLTLDFMLAEMIVILKNLRVYPERMAEIIRENGGLMYSQRLLLALIGKGLARFEAYGIVQDLCRKVWKDRSVGLEELSRLDGRVSAILSARDFKGIFDLGSYLKHVDEIYVKAGVRR